MSLRRGDRPPHVNARRLRDLNAAMGIGTDAVDPYRRLAERGATPPLIRAGDYGTYEGEPRPVFTTSDFHSAQAVLTDARFSSAINAEKMNPLFGHSLLEMDGAEHDSFRGVIEPLLTRRISSEVVAPATGEIVAELMEAVAPATSADLVDALTTRYPVLVILRLLDMPARLADRLQRRSTEVLGPTVRSGRARRGSRALTRTLSPFVRSRRNGGGHDLVTRIASAQLDGRPLSDEEVLSFLRLLVPAATDTPYRASSTLLHALLTHPDQLRLVREDRALLDDALEESLRWECPLLSVTRCAAEDVQILGVDVPEGAMVIVDIGAANRDPQRWVEPDRFDILRPRKTNLAFSGGPHLCAGIHMAKAEIPAMLDTLLDGFPLLRLDERGPVPSITGTEWRVPVAVPARWD